jgi:hypothetical protein
MKSSHLWAIASFTVLLVLMIRPRYSLKCDFDPYVNVLSNTNEVFIFIGIKNVGHSGPYIGSLLRRVQGIYSQALDKRDDLIVVHISNDQILKIKLANFRYSGSAFPLAGTIYYSRGGEAAEWPLLWQWTGTTFTKVERDKALKLMSSFQYTSDLIKAEGWMETHAKLDQRRTEMKIPVGSGQCIITLKEPIGREGVKTIKISQIGSDITNDVLSEIDVNWQTVSKKVYKSAFGFEDLQ